MRDNVKSYTNKEFVAALAKYTKFTQGNVKEVLDAIGPVLHEMLAEVTEENEVMVHVTKDFSILNTVRPALSRPDLHKLDGSMIYYPASYITKAKFGGKLKHVIPDTEYGEVN